MTSEYAVVLVGAFYQALDFFAPVVDDPYDDGALAVANTLSDVYAMGC